MSAQTLKLHVLRLEDRVVPAVDMVLHWNEITLVAQQNDIVVGQAPEQRGPTKSARALGIVSAAVYDAVNSIDESYTAYLIDVNAANGASIDAAAAQAAHDTLVALYPRQKAYFDAELTTSLAGIASQSAQDGIAVGRQVAANILAWRASDPSGMTGGYTPGTGPLDWKPDPLHPAQTALSPDWGNITPFTIISSTQFQLPPPPAVGSAEYEAAFAEVKAYGGDGLGTPTIRTQDQTQAGIFWGYDGQPGLGTPPRMYNQIVSQIAIAQGNSEIENARLFALVNLAMADAGISSWKTKYTYSFARPITAIREAANDGNPNTVGVVDWSPLGAPADNGNGTNFTPPFPAYSSGHATFGGAVFESLRNFYGTDRISFTLVSDEYNGRTVDQNGNVRPLLPRHFDTLSQAEEENGQSRIYLGIHWSFDKTGGILQGNQIADWAFNNFLKTRDHAIPTSPVIATPYVPERMVVGADAGADPRVKVLDGSGTVLFDFLAFDPTFTGGVRVAQGDVNNDGTQDIIVAAGPGGGSHVKVFDGRDLSELYSFHAYDANFQGGVSVAVGDVNGDGFADIVTGAGPGAGPHVKVFSGRDGSELQSFYAFDSSNRAGVDVAAGDTDGDGRAEVIVSCGAGAAPMVRVFDGTSGELKREFFAFDLGFAGGVSVAAGDLNGDGLADIIVGAGAGAGAHVKAFDARGAELASFYAFSTNSDSVSSGVRVGAEDRNGDGRADMIAAMGPGTGPLVECRELGGLRLLEQMYAYDPAFLGGVNV